MTKSFSVVTSWFVLLISAWACPASAQQESQNPGFGLVTPAWLAQHAQDPSVRILDVRPDAKDYFTGHIPNAVYLADASLRGPKNGFPAQYWSDEMLGDILKAAGVTNQTTVVIHSDADKVVGATMVAYTLNRIGHKSVKILDGGISAFQVNQKLSQEYPKYTAGRLTVARDKKVAATLADVRKALKERDVTFVDARPAKAYQGDIQTWMRNGHIPGAINVDWTSLMSSENPHQFRSVEEMQKVFTDRGVTRDKNLVVYCGTSREASLEFFVLKHVLKYPAVRLYEGSLAEYSANADLPLEKGPGSETKK